MPRVTHVKKARRAVPAANIKVGDEYWWWNFNRAPKSFSKTPPKRQQLTRSYYLIGLYDLEDRVSALTAGPELVEDISDLIDTLNERKEECEGSLENMPDSLKTAPSGETLQERIDACENAVSELESIDTEPDEGLDEEDLATFWDSVLESIQAVTLG